MGITTNLKNADYWTRKNIKNAWLPSKLKSYTLKFNKVNEIIFKQIKSGKKKVETRANSTQYQNIKEGDSIVFVCDGSSFKKQVAAVSVFKSIESLLKKYKPEEINPALTTLEETVQMYHSFPGYKEKIKKFGLIALELK